MTRAAPALAAEVRKLVPGGVDVAIECSGAIAAVEASIVCTAAGGLTALVGIPAYGARASFDPADLLRGRQIVGSLNGAIDVDRDPAEIVQLARAGKLLLAAQITRVWPLTEVADAIAAVRRGEVVRAVLDHTS